MSQFRCQRECHIHRKQISRQCREHGGLLWRRWEVFCLPKGSVSARMGSVLAAAEKCSVCRREVFRPGWEVFCQPQGSVSVPMGSVLALMGSALATKGKCFGSDGNRFHPDGKCFRPEGKRLARMGGVLAAMGSVRLPREVFRLLEGRVMTPDAFSECVNHCETTRLAI